MKIVFRMYDYRENVGEILSGISEAMAEVSTTGAFVTSVGDTCNDAYVIVVSNERLTAEQAQGLFNRFWAKDDFDPYHHEVQDVAVPIPTATKWER